MPDERVRIRGHNRCPYCHDGVDDPHERAACAHCLAVHHVPCWRELGRCAACQADQPLLPPRRPEPARPPSAAVRRAPSPSSAGPMSYDDAQWALEVTRSELTWLIARGRLVAGSGKQGPTLSAQQVLGLRGEVPALMAERQRELGRAEARRKQLFALLVGSTACVLVLLAAFLVVLMLS